MFEKKMLLSGVLTVKFPQELAIIFAKKCMIIELNIIFITYCYTIVQFIAGTKMHYMEVI